MAADAEAKKKAIEKEKEALALSKMTFCEQLQYQSKIMRENTEAKRKALAENPAPV